MNIFAKLIKFLTFKTLQYLWTTLTAFRLIGNRLRYGNRKRLHPKPGCLEGWNSNYLQLKSIKLHYVQTGEDDAPLFLMIHGFPEFWYSWRYQLNEFKDKYRCVAIDMRGYNQSEKPKNVEDYQIELLCSDIKDVIEKLGYKKAVIMGHDWGANVAWRTALMFPDHIEKLIICNVPHPNAFYAGGFEQLLKSWYIFMFQSPYIPEASLEMNDFETFQNMFRGNYGGLKNKQNFTDEDLEAFKHAFSQEGAVTAAINYYRCIPHMTTVKGEEAIVKPETLVIWGTGDPFLTVSGAKKSLDFCRRGFIRWIDGASHWVQQDEPEVVNSTIREFLQGTFDEPKSSKM